MPDIARDPAILKRKKLRHALYAAVGVLIFSGLIAYDTQKIKEQYADAYGTDVAEKMAIFGALSLYLDFVNLFQFLMSFMGQNKD